MGTAEGTSERALTIDAGDIGRRVIWVRDSWVDTKQRRLFTCSVRSKIAHLPRCKILLNFYVNWDYLNYSKLDLNYSTGRRGLIGLACYGIDRSAKALYRKRNFRFLLVNERQVLKNV